VASGLLNDYAVGREYLQKLSQSCADFDPTDPKFVATCPEGMIRASSGVSPSNISLNAGCLKATLSGNTVRVCKSANANDECVQRLMAWIPRRVNVTVTELSLPHGECSVCQESLCNTAGVAAPALLPLLATLLVVLLKV